MRAPTAPFFIVGPGRSGTSLLMAMLDSHPTLRVPPETHFLRRYVVGQGRVSGIEASRLLRHDERFARCGIPVQAIVSGDEETVDWARVYRHFLQQVGDGHPSPTIVGDKDPRAVEHLRIIHIMFPDAWVLEMVRDPRDVYLSRRKARWSAGRHWFQQLLPYRIHHGLGSRLGPKLFGGRYREVIYEDLIRSPERVLREITGLLGIEYRPEMLTYHEHADTLIADEERAWKANLGSPVISDNYEKWREALDRTELLRVEAICAPVFEGGYYDAAVQDLNVKERLIFRFLKALAALAEMGYLARLKCLNFRAVRRLSDF